MGQEQFFLHYLIFVNGLLLLVMAVYSFVMPPGFARDFGWSWKPLGFFSLSYGVCGWNDIIEKHIPYPLFPVVNMVLFAVTLISLGEFVRRILIARKAPANEGYKDRLIGMGLWLAAAGLVLLGLKVVANVYLVSLPVAHWLDHVLNFVPVFIILFALTLIHDRYLQQEPLECARRGLARYRGYAYLFLLIPVLIAGYFVVGNLSRGGLGLDEKELKTTGNVVSGDIDQDTEVASSLVSSLSWSLGFISVGPVATDDAVVRINSTLDRYSRVLEGSVCYVMDLQGKVIASSNRAEKDSFVGKNYALRPYFKDALARGTGSYVAMGLTSKVAGFYAAAAINGTDGAVVGVAVIKYLLVPKMLDVYTGSQVILVHASGIVLVASSPEVSRLTLWPLSAIDHRAVLESKQFPVPYGRSWLPARPRNGDILPWQGAEALFFLRPSGLRNINIVVLRKLHDFYAWQMWGFAGLLFVFMVGFLLVVWNEYFQRNQVLRLARERKVEELAKQMEIIFNSSQVGLMLVDSAFNVKRLNQVASDMGGGDLAAHVDYQPGNVVRGAEALHTFRTPSGESKDIWLEINATPLDIEGECHTLFSMADITERKRFSETLLESKERFDAMTEFNGIVTWEVDAAGLFTYVSHVSEKVFGYLPNELKGRRHFYDIHPEEGREAFKRAAFEVFRQKGAFNRLQNTIQRKDGRIIWVSTSGLPLLNPDGTLKGYRGSDIDITAQREAEEERNRRIKELEIFYKASIGREERIVEL
ncbi:MAG: PAS domain S-box protein, partial [Candidatus Omnitrophica bacterium]|nr:PAS domain S-box protein [Candidatus Omnitrophota bacterium]